MTTILAIDPGSTESGWALIDSEDCKPRLFGKWSNDAILDVLCDDVNADHLAIEMIRSYGMAVGAEVFATCVWIGRFQQAADIPVTLVYRGDVKLHLCHSSKAKDANVTQALVDRFAPGAPNRGKGTKVEPGWFYGFAGDVWQAYALAVQQADLLEGRDS